MQEFDISKINFPEECIIGSAKAAKLYVDGVMAANESQWKAIELMEDHINGKRPKSPERLKKQGKTWVNNWNFGKARSKIESTVGEHVDVVLNALMLMSVNFKPQKEKELVKKNAPWMEFMLDPDLLDAAAFIVAESLNETIDRESSVINFINTLEYNATAWGWAAATADHKLNWMGQAHHVRAIAFEEKTRPEDIKGFVTIDKKSARELWKLWSDFKHSENVEAEEDDEGNVIHKHPSGWIIEGLEEALFYCYKGKIDPDGKMTYALNSFKDILPDFVQSPSATIANTESLSIVKVVTFEFGGDKATTSLLAYNNGWTSHQLDGKTTRYGRDHSLFGNMQGANPKYLLCQYTEKIHSVDQVISLIYDSGFTTNGAIQDMRGIAKIAVEDGLRHDRHRNDFLDKLSFAGRPILRKEDNSVGDAGPQIMPSEGFCLISRGFGFLPEQPKIDVSQHMMALQMEETNYSRDVEHFDPKISGKISSRPVRQEIEVISSEVQRAEGARTQIKLRCYGVVFRNMLRGLSAQMREVKEANWDSGLRYFVEKCIDRLSHFGVDDHAKLSKLLNEIDTVQLDKALTNAEAIIEQLQVAESAYDRMRLNRMLMLARGFSRKEVIKRYPLKEHAINEDEEWMAAQENAAMATTSEILYSPKQNPIAHLNTHFPKFFGLLEQITNGTGDPMPSYNWAARVLQHMGMHLDQLLKSAFISDAIKQRYLTNYKEGMMAIADLRKQIEDMAERMRQAAAQQQQSGQQGAGIDPKTQAQIENDRLKLMANMDIKAAQSQFRQQEKQKDAELRRSMQAEDHQARLKRQEELQSLKLEVEKLKASINLGSL